jgi:polyhydroxybutyrate depolymerase
MAVCAARASAQELATKLTQSMQTADGRTRTWDVYGSTALPQAPRPVLLVFHGGASTKEAMPPVTCPSGSESDPGCLNRLAALGPENYLVVYPQGFLLSWNAGNCCGPAMANGVDDVAFVAQMLDRLETDFDIDERRVYATGFSNGAMLAHRLGCALSDRIAAIAPVSGGIGLSDAECQPDRPVPVLEFHGTDDENYPYEGGVGGGVSGTDFVGIPDTVAGWASRDACSTAFDETPIGSIVPEDGTTVFRESARDCRGAEVVLFRIVAGGHTWPGGSPNLTAAGFGTVSRDVDANREMLAFFSRQIERPRQGPQPSAPLDRPTREVARPSD